MYAWENNYKRPNVFWMMLMMTHLLNIYLPCGQEWPTEYYPEIVLFSNMGIKKCNGHKGDIFQKLYQPPANFGFYVKAQCIWKEQMKQ